MKAHIHGFMAVLITMIAMGGGRATVHAHEHASSVISVEAMITPPPEIHTATRRQTPPQQPFQPGEPPVKPLPVTTLTAEHIEGHTKYLTADVDTTKWVGPDPTWIAVRTKTFKHEGKPDEVVTATQGVEAVKNAKGGVNVIFSPGVRDRLVDLAKEAAKACGGGAKKKMKRASAACPVRFANSAMEDPVLRKTFTNQLPDQFRAVFDEGYHGDPADAPHYKGQGFPDQNPTVEPFEDEGFFESDHDFYDTQPSARPAQPGQPEPAPGGGEAATIEVETPIIGSPESVTAIKSVLSTVQLLAEAAPALGFSPLGSVFMGTFLVGAFDWFVDPSVKTNEMTLPQAIIQVLTKTVARTKDKPDNQDDKTKHTTTTSSSSKSCPSASTLTDCGNECKATSTTLAKPTGVVLWACSEGKDKDCLCNPGGTYIADTADWKGQLAIFAALDEAVKKHGAGGGGDNKDKPGDKSPPQLEYKPQCSDGQTQFGREFLGDVHKAFCKDHFKRDTESTEGLVLDNHGKVSPHKKIKRTVTRDQGGNDTITTISTSGHHVLVARGNKFDQGDYDDIYWFKLKWKPSTDKKAKCVGFDDDDKMCNAVFNNLTLSDCGTPKTEQKLSRKASLNIGCGEFSWEILGDPKRPEIGKRKCYKSYKHPDVRDKEQRDVANKVCGMQKGPSNNHWTEKEVGKGWRASNPVAYKGPFKPQWMHYEFHWVEGCKSDLPWQDWKLPTTPFDGPTCEDLMYGNWKECNNHGSGGYIDVGCVRYEFHAGDAELKNKATMD